MHSSMYVPSLPKPDSPLFVDEDSRSSRVCTVLSASTQREPLGFLSKLCTYQPWTWCHTVNPPLPGAECRPMETQREATPLSNSAVNTHCSTALELQEVIKLLGSSLSRMVKDR